MDFGIPMMKHMYFQRTRTYRSLGFEIRQERMSSKDRGTPESQMSIFG
ncbi:MAG: hypothetical protein WCG83_02185 [Candidatus Peregrinibacteria bacterium]